jgi:NADH-quinone oxidoreductase subunit M
MVQPDLKKLVAYSSVSHLGFVMLGIASLTATAVTGAVYQMLNHGVSTGGLFLLAGMLHERAHTRELRAFGGLGRVLPSYALCFGLVMLSSAALPLTNGFVGELACLLGAFQRSPWWAALGGLGTILGAVYLLHLMHRLFFGPKRAPEGMEAKDLSAREWAVLAPLVAMIFVMGLAPGPFFEKTAPAAKAILARVESSRARRQGTASREAPELAGNRLARAGEGGRAR